MQDAQKTFLRWSLKKLGFFLKNGVFILFLVMLVLNPIMIPQGWCSFAATADDQHHQKQNKHSIFQEKTQIL